MLVALATLLVAGVVVYERHASISRGRLEGEALFHGAAALPGQLEGHDALLPTLATRCSNCHEVPTVAPRQAVAAAPGVAAARAADTSAATGLRSYANALDRQSLESARSRRGGPPSRFDAASLCTLMRTGVDPAQVVIPPTMPRYRATDSQCEALWAYLLTR